MLTKFGEKFSDLYQKYLPDAFVFALLMTLLTGIAAYFWVEASPLKIISSWYDGFWSLLSFGMQIVLIIITGFSIALSPIVGKGIDKLATYIKTPVQVYYFVVLLGGLFSLISFGWIVITCVLARELASRVKGVHYPYLIACVYFAGSTWVYGLSSSIPLLLNSEKNYLIEAGVLDAIIPTSLTLGSSLNIALVILGLIASPLLLTFLRPKKTQNLELDDLLLSEGPVKKQPSIKEAAYQLRLPGKSISDILNNSKLLHIIIALGGFTYIVYHFINNGFDLNFNIMIFIFLMIGLLVHQTPMRYVISMKRASSNVSGILFQYPFYAGIMGIMLYTGLGEALSQGMASIATKTTYPFFAFLTGGVVNIAIPSAGGEFAVVGPSILNAVREIGAGLPIDQVNAMFARASLSVAYGESLTNLLQPFYLLLVLPIMGAGIKIQAREIMGYLFIPFLIYFIALSCILVFWPL